jgi:hypothetical protein
MMTDQTMRRIVADRLVATLEQARAGKIERRPLAELRRAKTDGRLRWLAR